MARRGRRKEREIKRCWGGKEKEIGEKNYLFIYVNCHIIITFINKQGYQGKKWVT